MEIPGARTHMWSQVPEGKSLYLLILTFGAFTGHQFLIFLCA